MKANSHQLWSASRTIIVSTTPTRAINVRIAITAIQMSRFKCVLPARLATGG